MKKSIFTIMTCALASFSYGAGGESGDMEPKFTIPLQIDIQAKKAFDETADENNLSSIYGRLRIKLNYEDANIKSHGQLMFYPADFGYEALRTEQNLAGADSVTLEQLDQFPLSKTLVYQAWIKTKGKPVNFKIGRFDVGSREGHHFGDYLEHYTGPGFMGGGETVNGAEVMGGNDMIHADFGIEFKDDQLNTGDLRFEAHLFPSVEKGFFAKAGWKANVIDITQNDDADVLHTVAAGAGFKIDKGMKAFAEWGYQDLNAEDDDHKHMPITAGFQMPVGTILDAVVLEAEFEGEREHNVLPALFLKKNINDYFGLYVGAYNTGKQEEFAESFEMAVRLSGFLNPKAGNLSK